MIKSIPVRVAIVALFVIVALISLYPTYVPKDETTGKAILPEWWTKLKFLPTKRINLGLDLRGGIYLVYTVKIDEVAKLEGEAIIETAESEEWQKEGVQVSDSNVTEAGEVSITFADSSSYQAGGKKIDDRYKALWDIRADSDTPNKLILSLKPAELAKAKENAINQVRRTVANRIDEWGLAETSVVVKPPDQLMVELPGITDTKRVDEVIKTTANLELKLVLDSAESKEALLQKKGGRISRSQEIYEHQDPKTKIVNAYLLMEKRADITGDCISGARMGIGGDFGTEPVVYFNLRPGDECAGKFGRLTGQNIGKQLAIVLDNKVMSAPVVRSRISDSGQIEGQFTSESATDLAIVLTTGSLKVPLVKDRVEVIGPSLGQDHIRRGQMAIIVGSLLVVVFMVIYYKMSGVIADLALALNILFLLAAMATFGATLTLPGLAGILLTVGMAVDANVLINERIREEMRFGKTPQAAVELGYGRAFLTIFDSNLTTFIAGLVLYINGTGPIKGFAVTLMFGIAISMLTAIFVTRIIFDYRLEQNPGEALSI